MKTKIETSVMTLEQKALLQEIANQYGTSYKYAISQHPEWGQVLKDVKDHNVYYHLKRFVKVQKIQDKVSRKTSVTRTKASNNTPKSIVSLQEPFHCLTCKRHLTNVINSILLEQQNEI